jgi:hypothetical protein
LEAETAAISQAFASMARGPPGTNQVNRPTPEQLRRNMAKFREETQHGHDEEIGDVEEYSDESDGDSYGKLDGVATAM